MNELQTPSWFLEMAARAIGRRAQTHIVINHETGRTELHSPLCRIEWPSVQEALNELNIPAYGRVFVHVE